ncbi:MAG: hypothetical protein Q7R49_01410 [Candidatus Daviesbacteria bacterium]|nr:hypothetical protein [Candidatus Daviesbacteria bacterium]
MAFSRDRNSNSGGRSGGDRGGFRPRPSFGGDRPRFGSPRFRSGEAGGGDRGPVEMHKAICDSCGKECEVPFRPTQGKPVFCSDCFRNQQGEGGSESRYSGGRNTERSNSYEDRQMFKATCADCGKECEVPFRPTGEKPVFCSNCFGSKKNAGGSTGNANGKDEFAELNAKLDKILKLLSGAAEEVVMEEINEAPTEIEEETPAEVMSVAPAEAVEKPVKIAKKKSAKKSPIVE